MMFTPRFWPTALALPVFIVLVGLGWWQLQRLEWKLGLIEAAQTRATAPALPLEEALAGAGDDTARLEYRRVTAQGRFDHGREVYLFTTHKKRAGYKVLTPLLREDAPPVLVDRGFVPQALKEPGARAQGQIAGAVEVTGLLRAPQEPGSFTPPPDLEARVWYARDVAAMKQAIGLDGALPFVLDADDTANPGGWPKGGVTRLEFSNRHLGYALTWFGLALTLVTIYIAYHLTRGRRT